MISIGSRALWTKARRSLRQPDGDSIFKGEWLSSGEGPGIAPTVFLAEQPPHYHFPPHFHRVNQFQLFVDGDGTLGRTAVRPLVVHYAGAYTGYGPIVSGDNWLKYFTVRAQFETGNVPLERARTEMLRGPKRHAHTDPVALRSEAAISALTDAVTTTLMAPGDDGLGASLVGLGRNAGYPVRHLDASVGQFVFVMGGALHCGENTLEKWEPLYIPHGESAALRAGPAGAEILVLSMPELDPAYRQEPTTATPPG